MKKMKSWLAAILSLAMVFSFSVAPGMSAVAAEVDDTEDVEIEMYAEITEEENSDVVVMAETTETPGTEDIIEESAGDEIYSETDAEGISENVMVITEPGPVYEEETANEEGSDENTLIGDADPAEGEPDAAEAEAEEEEEDEEDEGDEEDDGILLLSVLESVPYVDANGASYTATNVTEVEDDVTTWSDGWYVVDSYLEISSRIEVSGTVNLILADDYTLTADSGIQVNSGNTLNIYGQSGGSGKLIATGSSNNAGIGGAYAASGSITINGGEITATGGNNGAGIGGGRYGNGGTITINGGIVNATGNENSSAIGGGYNGSSGTITINGGVITAEGGNWAAGIGGGIRGGATNVNITGGTIIATGKNGGAGIGNGPSYSGSSTIAIENCVIYASEITGLDASSHSGIIYVGSGDGPATVYGSPVFSSDVCIPEGKTAQIEDEKTVTIAGGATLTNDGTLYQDWGSTFTKTGTYADNGSTYYQVVNSLTGLGQNISLSGVSTYSGNTYATESETVSLPSDYIYSDLTVTKNSSGTVSASEGSFTMPDEPVQLTGSVQKEITESMFTVNTDPETYTGDAITKSIVGSDDGNTMSEGTDYTVYYEDNIHIGTARITITGEGNYTGTLDYEFTILQAAQYISYEETQVEKLDYDDPFINELTQTLVYGEITYSFEIEMGEEPVIEIDETTGEVTIKNPGVVTVTATASGGDDYEEATASYILTVNSDEISVKIEVNNDEVGYDDDKEEYTDELTYDGEDLELEIVLGFDSDEEAHLTLNDITYQWYDYDPDTGTLSLIDGATGDTYTLTGDAVGVGDYVYLCVAVVIYDNGYEHTVYGVIEIKIDKADQMLAFAENSIEKGILDEDPFINELTGAQGSVTYTSSDENVVTVDAATGLVTITGVGKATITATAAETDNYKETSASYNITVIDVVCVSVTDGSEQEYYYYVQDAIDAALDGVETTITMIADSNEELDISAEKIIVLDLDGHTLKALGNVGSGKLSTAITNKGILTLKDSAGGGTVTGGYAGVSSVSTHSSGGAGVYNTGTFYMEGGTITGNRAEDSLNFGDRGAGVYNSGTFVMDGGEISGNSSSGGAVYNSGTFTMNNGSISNNTCNNGGGVLNRGSFTMNGGSISGNSAVDLGGGICNSGGTFTMYGGAVYGNTAGISAADIYNESGSTITLIAAEDMDTGDYPVNGWFYDKSGSRYASATDPAEYTPVDSDTSEPELTAGCLVTVSFDINGGSGTVPDEQTWKDEYATVTMPSGDGFTVPEGLCEFAGWSTAADGSGDSYDADEEYTLKTDTTLYAQWYEHEWETVTEVIENTEDEFIEMVGMECVRCGLTYEEEILVATESEGVTAHSTLTWRDLISEDDLAALFEDGAEIDFKLSVADYNDDVPGEEKVLVKDLVDQMWNKNTIFYLDISPYMNIIHADESEESQTFTATLNPITITVAIPDELLNAEGDGFEVIRIHDGEAEFLPVTDNGDGTLTFMSDKFSTYAIAKGYMSYDLTAQINGGEDISRTYDGCSVELTVETAIEPEVDGEVTYTYQWYLDGAQIEGADGDILTLNGDVADSGTYSCVVGATYPNGRSGSATGEITVTIGKANQDLSFAEDSVEKGTLDDPFTNELTGAQGSVTYTSSNEGVAKVDAASGEVTIVSFGEAIITATAAETENYNGGATASYDITVTCDHLYSDEKNGDGNYVYITTDWSEDGAECTFTFACTVCGEKAEVDGTVTEEVTVEPWCTTEGNDHFTADASIESADGTTVSAEAETDIAIPALGHDWEWSDEVVSEGDTTTARVYFTCTRCGAEVEEDIIVETGSVGIEVHTDLNWNDVFSADDLAELFEQYTDGEEIDIALGIGALDEKEVPEEDARLIKDVVDQIWNESDIFYMDISLILTVTHNEDVIVDEAVTETNLPVTFTVTIPDELLNAEGNSYMVIRIHDGEAEILPTTDNGDGTLTFASDKFSTYAIAKGYMAYDMTVQVNGGEDITKTYDGSSVELSVETAIDPEVDGEITYTYQWYLDGAKIEGADGSSLTLSGSAADSGTYSCFVTATLEDGTVIMATSDGIAVTISKAAQSPNFSDGSTVTKTESDAPFTNPLTGAYGDVTYTSSDESVAIVDADGNVTIIGPGTATITAVIAGDEDHEGTEISYTLTVTGDEDSGGSKRDEITEPGPVIQNGGTGTTGGTDGNTGTDGTGSTGANTADTNDPILYGILVALAGAAIVTLGVRRRVIRR